MSSPQRLCPVLGALMLEVSVAGREAWLDCGSTHFTGSLVSPVHFFQPVPLRRRLCRSSLIPVQRDGLETCADLTAHLLFRAIRKLFLHITGSSFQCYARVHHKDEERPAAQRGPTDSTVLSSKAVYHPMPTDTIDIPQSSQNGTEQVPDEYGNVDPEVEEGANERLAAVILCDDSFSTEGDDIDQINRGLELFGQELTDDEVAAETVEPAIVSFGGGVDVVQDFVKADSFQPPTLSAGGNTPMGDAVLKALDMVEGRKSTYRDQGYEVFRPWVFLFTDGKPNGGSTSIDQAAKAIAEAEREDHALFWAAGTEDADFDALKRLSQRPTLKVKEADYTSLFKFLSDSLKQGSNQDPGDTIQVTV